MSEKTGNLTKLMEGYNPHRQLLEQTRKLVTKWEPTGLLEGLNKEHVLKVFGMFFVITQGYSRVCMHFRLITKQCNLLLFG